MGEESKRFYIRLMQKEDIEEVARLLSITFPDREPCTSYLGISHEDFYEHFGKEWTEECAKDDLSFVCLDTQLEEGKQIIGFRCSHPLKLSEIKEVKIDDNDNFNVTDAFSDVVNDYKREWFKVHSEEKDAKCVFFLALGTKEGYENLGIASKLVNASLNNAKEKGYDYVYVIASAAQTQHIFENKYKFKAIIRKEYEKFEYKGVNFLSGVKITKELIGYELDLRNWDSTTNEVINRF
ncbi:hypothetical protein B4U80_13149 [Leptotrombidium deliense]|uniref:N-acetyltransferase domain-containing protein n=1 Tax=Leptotrombidium deliense TaxID=299467 RepID=A0A443SBQ4_9ACAR|nr:hypothetical protein B4U80_13149 [Leptotrombidium deliense]